MNTKTLLEKTYECKNLEELYTLINGTNSVWSSDSNGYWGNNRDYFLGTLYGNTILNGSRIKDSEIDNFPELYPVNFETYYEYNGGETLRNPDWVRLPQEIKKNFLYFGEDEKVYMTNLSFVPKDPNKIIRASDGYRGSRHYYEKDNVILKVAKWKTVERIADIDLLCLQPVSVVLNWYKQKNQYGYKWLMEDYLGQDRNHNNGRYYYRRFDADIPFIVTHSELELLDKMTINDRKGLALIDSIANKYSTKSDRQMYNRMFKNGTKAADIFALPMNFVRVLWSKPDIKTWDTTRKMVNLRDCTIDDIVRCDERNMRNDQYGKIDEILRAKDHNGKPVFTFTTLLNYLQKIDVNEAIELDEGLALIADTITMARQARQIPNFDTDSLKRTHDIMMRNARYVRNEKTVQGIEASCNKKYNFQDGKYFVRQIESYADLMDEGEQQHNCLRYCYASRIADKTSLIYVMRKVDEPKKSLISIELDPTGEVVRQKLAAYNAQITNEGQLKFIEKWNDYRAKINAKEENI